MTIIKTKTSKFGSIVVAAMLLCATAAGAIDNVTHGNQASLRGLTQLDETPPADEFKHDLPDREPYISNYVYQPPLIPHKIRHYELSLNANKCLSCHSFKNAREEGATKISVTHYATREGAVKPGGTATLRSRPRAADRHLRPGTGHAFDQASSAYSVPLTS